MLPFNPALAVGILIGCVVIGIIAFLAMKISMWRFNRRMRSYSPKGKTKEEVLQELQVRQGARHGDADL